MKWFKHLFFFLSISQNWNMYNIFLDLGARASCAHFAVFKICIMGYNDAYRRLSSLNVNYWFSRLGTEAGCGGKYFGTKKRHRDSLKGCLISYHNIENSLFNQSVQKDSSSHGIQVFTGKRPPKNNNKKKSQENPSTIVYLGVLWRITCPRKFKC